MSTETPTSNTEAAILTRVIAPDEPTLSPEAAKSILSLSFAAADRTRISELIQKNNAGIITAAEKDDLEKYLRVGQFLDLMQAKARLSLQSDQPESR